MKRRIGLLGGTFDPIHFGHLLIAERCREVGNLAEIWFLPAAQPPHKQRGDMANLADRRKMIELAIRDNPGFRLEMIEAERAGPSYTVDTLRELHHRCPDTDFHFILGADGVLDLPGWYRPREILELCTLCIVARPGFAEPNVAELAERLGMAGQSIAHAIIPSVQIDISSRDIRSRTARGNSIRYMLPDTVEAWIEERGLYR